MPCSDHGDHPSKFYIFCLLISIILYFLDIAFDVYATVSFYKDGECYFATAIFLVIPISFSITWAISWWMYTQDHDNSSRSGWIKVFEQPSLRRYIDAFTFALKSYQAKKQQNTELQAHYFKKMQKVNADVALLRLFEIFTEAAPQQVVAICYLLNGDTIAIIKGDYLKLLSGISSFFFMAYCLLTYQKDIRAAQNGTNPISIEGSILTFLWHLCISVSRIFTISALFHNLRAWAFLFIFVHWFLMTTGISFCEKHRSCWSVTSIAEHRERKFNSYVQYTQKLSEKFRNYLFSAGLGLILIFVYITPGAGRTLYRHIFYYSMCLAENIAVAVLWYNFYEGSTFIFCMCFVPYLLGLAFMLVYYLMFHPTRAALCSMSQCKLWNISCSNNSY